MKLVRLINLSATQQWAGQLANSLPTHFTVYLHGEMGTGKTTFVRSLLGQLGYQGKVVSPTYTLVEAYELAQGCLVHLDLYRLGTPEEVTNLGLDRWYQDLMMVEWPQKGQGFLPTADLVFYFDFGDDDNSRLVRMVAESPQGNEWLNKHGKDFTG